MARESVDTKQKVMSIILVILVVIGVWQGWQLFASGDDATPAVTTLPVPGQQAGVTGAAPRVITHTLVKPAPEVPLTPEEKAAMADAGKTRASYLRLVNEYQLMQVKKLLADTKAAIAEQEAAASKSQLDQLNATVAAKKVRHDVLPELGVADGQNDMAFDRYRLVFVGHKYGRASAVLMLDNKPVDIRVGSTLQDGSEVISIGRSSVVIAKDLARKRITLSGTAVALQRSRPVVKKVKAALESSTEVFARPSAPASPLTQTLLSPVTPAGTPSTGTLSAPASP